MRAVSVRLSVHLARWQLRSSTPAVVSSYRRRSYGAGGGGGGGGSSSARPAPASTPQPPLRRETAAARRRRFAQALAIGRVGVSRGKSPHHASTAEVSGRNIVNNRERRDKQRRGGVWWPADTGPPPDESGARGGDVNTNLNSAQARSDRRRAYQAALSLRGRPTPEAGAADPCGTADARDGDNAHPPDVAAPRMVSKPRGFGFNDVMEELGRADGQQQRRRGGAHYPLVERSLAEMQLVEHSRRLQAARQASEAWRAGGSAEDGLHVPPAQETGVADGWHDGGGDGQRQGGGAGSEPGVSIVHAVHFD
eukprot:COSAG01_NODE_258_length_20077_cov_124.162429_20_plen_309_part_00